MRLLIFLLMVITVSRVHSFIGLAALRPAFVLAVLTAIYAFLNPHHLNEGALLRTWPGKVIVALGVVACISVPFGISLGGAAMFIISRYSKVLIFAVLLILAIRHARDLNHFVWAYVLSCGILAYLALVVVGVSKTRGVRGYDANDVGLVLMVGLPLALWIMQSTDNRRRKLISLFVILGIGATIAVTGSRGGFVGLVAVGLALLFFLKTVPVAKRLLFVVAMAGALIVAAPAGYWEEMKSLTTPTEDYNWDSWYGRKELAKRGVGYMLANPLTGLGIGQFPRYEGMYTEHAMDWTPGRGKIKWSVSHNSFIEAGADMGIPGFVLFGSLIVGGIVALRRMRRRLPPSWQIGDPEERFLYNATVYLPISLIAFAATGFFITQTYHDTPYILAAFVAGVYASVDAKLRRDGSAVPPRVPHNGPIGAPASRYPLAWQERTRPGSLRTPARRS